MDLNEEIARLKRERNAVVLAHNYCCGEVQDAADFTGDSLELARRATQVEADVIVFCGVYFMAETAKILNPGRKVLVPDPSAGCPMADMITAAQLRELKAKHPGSKAVCYVNSTAEVKAECDICVTSGNAEKVMASFPKDVKIIFGPDYNLGNYINSVTGRHMLLWNGGCHVHEKFSVDGIVKLKQEHPHAVVMAHLECKALVLAIADVKGSTATMLKYAQAHPEVKEFIVATEAGILHEMQRTCPDQTFIPVPPEVSEGGLGCSCNECEYMKKNTLAKIYNALKYGWPSVEIDPAIAREAVKPIQRMLSLS